MRCRARRRLEKRDFSSTAPCQTRGDLSSCLVESRDLSGRNSIGVFAVIEALQQGRCLNGSTSKVERERCQGAELVVIESDGLADEPVEAVDEL